MRLEDSGTYRECFWNVFGTVLGDPAAALHLGHTMPGDGYAALGLHTSCTSCSKFWVGRNESLLIYESDRALSGLKTCCPLRCRIGPGVAMNVPFLLDSSLSESLKTLFPGGNAQKTNACGLSQNADDIDVIDLAYARRAVLVTTDHGIVTKCKAFQKQHDCMYGLLILPNGIEVQRHILGDLRKERKKLRFHKLNQPLTWAKIRDYNFLVRTQLSGHPHVSELCDCEVWRE